MTRSGLEPRPPMRQSVQPQVSRPHEQNTHPICFILLCSKPRGFIQRVCNVKARHKPRGQRVVPLSINRADSERPREIHLEVLGAWAGGSRTPLRISPKFGHIRFVKTRRQD